MTYESNLTKLTRELAAEIALLVYIEALLTETDFEDDKTWLTN